MAGIYPSLGILFSTNSAFSNFPNTFSGFPFFVKRNGRTFFFELNII